MSVPARAPLYRPPAFELRDVRVQGLRLEYRDLAATKPGRPVLVLLHEGLGCVALWRDFPDRLALGTGCRVLAWSRAGYGGSDPSPLPRTLDYLEIEAREALPAVLAALDVQHPVLIGHSDGATIALLHASLYPEVPLGVVAKSPHEFLEEETLAGLRSARTSWETSVWPLRLGRYHRDAERVFRDWNDTWLSPGFRDWSVVASLAALRCPVLAIQGEQDHYATMAQFDAIAERVPRTRLLKLPDCGHAPHLEQADRVRTAVVEFLGGWIGRGTEGRSRGRAPGSGMARPR